jgi:uroporphyrin-III C-methyltransferase/precorrin-2 dehydrogenase/sirohydrochlorin ferrochelatase
VTSFYPVSLVLRGRRSVVVGGGCVAEHKVQGLLEAGARVTVVSPEVTRLLEDLAAQGAVEHHRRPYRPGDLAGAFLAVAATDDRAVNGAIWAEAEARGVLLNAVDDLDHCHFIAPAIHRAGDITVAVSTAGKSPALAVRLRQRIAGLIGRAEARLCEFLGGLRLELAARVPDPATRTALWYRIVDSDVVDFVRRRDLAGARRRVEELVHQPCRGAACCAPTQGRGQVAAVPTRRTGVVYLVGAGPGAPGLITLRGLRILRRAEVVVYDRLVHPALVAAAPPSAERVFVGKRPGGHSVEQRRINAVLIERARAGAVVVRLKGGDPFVFGRGAEECEALRAAGLRFEVVPGVTSAVAAPGAAGIAVTHRKLASAFAVVAGHECDGASDLDWDALGRIPTLVFLMALRSLPRIAASLIAHGRRPETPAAVIAGATLPDERTVVGTLATIGRLGEEAGLEPPATLVVGEVVRLADLAPAAVDLPTVGCSAL